MKINKRHAQRATLLLLGVVCFFCYFDGTLTNGPQRFLSEDSPIIVSEVKLESDATNKPINMSDYYALHNYCKLDSRDDNKQCKKVLTGSALKSKPHWHFFGDSNMATLFQHLKPLYPHSVTVKRNESRTKDKCALMDYFGMEKDSVWIPPNEDLLQGPVAYGKHNPFCSDMMGWAPNMIGNENSSIEFLNVEFAQDVEYPTSMTSTTQETAALYLSMNKKEDHVCVVSAGTHDHEINKSPDTPQDQFIENVKKYFELLDSVCDRLVWVSISQMNEKWGTAEKNILSMDWNQKVSSMMSRTFPDNSYIIDVWDESVAAEFRGENTNKLHFEDSYYDKFASLFAGLLE